MIGFNRCSDLGSPEGAGSGDNAYQRAHVASFFPVELLRTPYRRSSENFSCTHFRGQATSA